MTGKTVAAERRDARVDDLMEWVPGSPEEK